ncbi:hypothetical protein [Pseudovibrio sp. Ad26]|uniref:hypothetical protein n=1 Tax=Pseudovibrio sp. Ad26 TaxID=989410 RepID=UPI0007B185BD|nr:hypothetical protein [Pseudovibrio sp. Ad26]KZL12680.1 hypothetical protein PsAD26_02258 [Pseudovibrio sp. Ad26]
MTFKSCKIALFKEYLAGAQLCSIGCLRDTANQDEIDNFLRIETNKGVINFYVLGTNPITNNDEDYLKYDHFNLFSLYDDLAILDKIVLRGENISDFEVCFETDGGELVGIGFSAANASYRTVFAHDEILLTIDSSTSLIDNVAEHLQHLPLSRLEVISVA